MATHFCADIFRLPNPDCSASQSHLGLLFGLFKDVPSSFSKYTKQIGRIKMVSMPSYLIKGRISHSEVTCNPIFVIWFEHMLLTTTSSECCVVACYENSSRTITTKRWNVTRTEQWWSSSSPVCCWPVDATPPSGRFAFTHCTTEMRRRRRPALSCWVRLTVGRCHTAVSRTIFIALHCDCKTFQDDNHKIRLSFYWNSDFFEINYFPCQDDIGRVTILQGVVLVDSSPAPKMLCLLQCFITVSS